MDSPINSTEPLMPEQLGIKSSADIFDHVKDKTPSSWIKIVIIAIFIGTLGIGGVLGYFVFRNRATSRTQLTVSSTPSSVTTHTPIVIANPTPTVDVIANWKTYTNDFYQYSLMYPPDWSVFEDASHDARFTPPGADIIANTPQDSPGSGIEPWIQVSMVQKPFTTPTPEASFSSVKPEWITIRSGQVGYYYISPSVPIPVYIFDVPFKKEPKMFEFNMISLGQDNINIFNQEHHTQVKDADTATFKDMIQTLKFF